MDSVTQFALGAAVGGVVLGRQAGRKAVLWGGICGTLPDLDVFLPFDDPVASFTYHRTVSHSAFFLTAAAPAVAAAIWLFERRLRGHFLPCLWMVWLALVTHPILDCFTVYGTQILLPLSDYPVTWSTMFIIDPVYSFPLLAGVIAAAFCFNRRRQLGIRLCAGGLVLSSIYLALSVGAKLHVDRVTRAALAEQDIAAEKFLTTPAAFSILLWRIVVMEPGRYREGFYSLLDDSSKVEFTPYPSETELLEPIADEWAVQRLRWFTKGFYRVRSEPQGVSMADLRMGMEPDYVFSFLVAERRNGRIVPIRARRLQTDPGVDRLAWVWQRTWNGPSRGSQEHRRASPQAADD